MFKFGAEVISRFEIAAVNNKIFWSDPLKQYEKLGVIIWKSDGKDKPVMFDKFWLLQTCNLRTNKTGIVFILLYRLNWFVHLTLSQWTQINEHVCSHLT